VYQAPCDGAALALEAWAVGGEDLRVQRFGQHAVAVSYDNLRWVFCGGISEGPSEQGVYAQTLAALEQMAEVLRKAGSGFEHAARTWFYLGGITDPEADTQRYKELNRARSDFYHPLSFHKNMVEKVAEGVYPASTGIGMQGIGITAGCLTLQTSRSDVRLLALENPRQTPAYAYHPRYSPQSPKFSRAMALVAGDYVTTWVSGTASIVDAESLHLEDPVRQTEQTIDNIERLISRENMGFHGIAGAGATLQDLAKIRVYVKRSEDYDIVRAICRKRFGTLPAIYAIADVCRPELLVEIEGVAFCRKT
jgi:enamine deaminase RidA (YjgF/YER057c/UK114 family)